MFSNKQLKDMILPLLMEQFLLMLVGLADTMVVSYAGEAAVSGVSLVNSFNTIFINLFTALASGGAVVVSQYIGRRDMKMASESSSQLLMVATVFAVVISIPVLIWKVPLLKGLFGKVEPDVMEACKTYLRISVYSFPALGIYNAGTALYRSIGKTSVTMKISIVSNLINVAGNLIGVFVFRAGVAGVVYPSLIARTFSAVVITLLCFREKEVRYVGRWIFQWNRELLKKMLSIAIPNGVESGIFQFVKVALSSVVALFGTYQIAANGISQSIWSVAALISVTMGPVFITVIGQCMGAGDIRQAEYYFRKLTKVTVCISVAWNTLIFLITPLLIKIFAVSRQTGQMILYLVLIHNIANAVVFPFADPLGKGLRAAGDAMFTMGISLFTTIGVRLILSILLGIVLDLGVIGIALAMCLDWTVRGVIFWIRFRQGKWKTYRVIGE
ncbi:MATE family efflux transporter [Blautia sp. MSJ-36]|uniref:MATE family efflux transporter n=1 Tax=Blautia sp. MSJ-36 TaxID=2841530 RepID=UPI001C119992|nr:MATE family efflux transporter [Blautia sp. MSJ-36]MBU5448639.1 MATE family efflux transporter [Blautia sp. MSJ-36]